MGTGRWGEKGRGREEEREGDSTDKYTQVQTQHNKTQRTQGRTKNTTMGDRGILRSFVGRSPDICQGGVEGLYIQ